MFNHQNSFDFYNWLETRVKVPVRRDNEVMPCQSCQTQAENNQHNDYLLDCMDPLTAEGNEKVEESKEEEQDYEGQ